MSKLGRNDQCLCGSGKKYKKCCMNKQQTPHQLTAEEQKDFNELLPKLFDFSKQFDDKIQPLYQQYAATFEHLKEADGRAFSQLLFHCLLYKEPLVDGNKSILATFIDEHYDSYSQGVQVILDKWRGLQPMLLSVEEKKNDHVVLKDLLNHVAILPEKTPITNQLAEGEFLVGFLYPTPTGVALGNDAVGIPSKYEERFMTEWNSLYESFGASESTSEVAVDSEDAVNNSKQAFFNNHFPAVLGIFTAIASGVFQDEGKGDWDLMSDQGALVLRELYTHIELSDYTYDAVLVAKTKWLDFLLSKKPRIQKPSVYAAVLEYWISKHDNQWTKQTFKQVAEKYEVSPSTVSSRFKEVNEFFSDIPVRVPHG